MKLTEKEKHRNKRYRQSQCGQDRCIMRLLQLEGENTKDRRVGEYDFEFMNLHLEDILTKDTTF